jgi:hypothetical protein
MVEVEFYQPQVDEGQFEKLAQLWRQSTWGAQDTG